MPSGRKFDENLVFSSFNDAFFHIIPMFFFSQQRQQLNSLKNLQSDLLGAADAWAQFYSASNPIDSLPQPYCFANLMTKLVILKWLRPDTLLAVIQQQLKIFFGEIGSVETQASNLNDAFKKSVAKVPIIILKAPDCNVSTEIIRLAEEMNAAER